MKVAGVLEQQGAGVAGGDEGVNTVWVSWTTMMTLAFTNMRNCCGPLANKGCELTHILK